ncbi:ESPR domain-containing protein, partial [Acidithiobacillus ferriphilus]|uniref:ESPR domain-containing protein n=1 Tax=Acidithiobacillus ferriphilus TaxID=1689834 RepID=UPI00242EF43A
MNTAYRIIFNRALGCLQVVSEHARGRGKAPGVGRGFRKLGKCLTLSILLCSSAPGISQAAVTTLVGSIGTAGKPGQTLQGYYAGNPANGIPGGGGALGGYGFPPGSLSTIYSDYYGRAGSAPYSAWNHPDGVPGKPASSGVGTGGAGGNGVNNNGPDSTSSGGGGEGGQPAFTG